MMNENYFVDEDYGMELRSLGSEEDDERLRRPAERIVLVMPREWLDPKQPLPTDKEFHRWVSEQLRARRRGEVPVVPSSNRSVASDRSDSSQLSAFGRRVQEVSNNVFGGVLRKRRNNQEQRNLLEDDCFDAQQRDNNNGPVGMELSVFS